MPEEKKLVVEPEEIETPEVEEEIEEVEEVDIEEEEEEPVKTPKDKKTAAIIREKQANKALRDEIAAMKKREEERERESKYAKYKQQLVEKGFSDDEVEEKVVSRKEREQINQDIKMLKYERQVDKLAEKYPSINEHLDSFINIVESSKGAITLADLCKLKLGVETTQEIKTKAEQNVLLNSKKAKEKQTVPGETKSTGSLKFSEEDESACKYYLSKNPGKTRSDYAKILEIKKG